MRHDDEEVRTGAKKKSVVRGHLAGFVDDLAVRLFFLGKKERAVLDHPVDSWDEFLQKEFSGGIDDFVEHDRTISEVRLKGRKRIFRSVISDISYPSPQPSSYGRNNTVWGKVYRPLAGPYRGTLIILPGWASDSAWFYRRIALGLNGKGYSAVIIDPPFQQRRCPEGFYNGELTLSADLIRTLRMYQQYTRDAHTAARWVQANWRGNVGIMGISMGGGAAGLCVASSGKFNFAVLMIPACDTAETFITSRLCRRIRNRLLEMGLTDGKIRRYLDPVLLRNHRPTISPDRILLLQSRYDRVIGDAQVTSLIRSWKITNVRRYHTGHVNVFWRSGRICSDITGFLKKI